jgi:hypothetical protein
MFNVLFSRQGKTNQIHVEILPYLGQNGCHQNKQIAHARADVGEELFIHWWWECKLVQPLGKSA